MIASGMPDSATLLQPSDLPGAATLETALIDEAVAHLNTVYTQRAMDTAVEIGTYIVDTFFGGDLHAFRTRERGHLSFNELAKHPSLQLDSVFLWRSVRILEQLEQLPSEHTARLSFSHQTELLPVRELKTKRRLARHAVQHGWTVRQLRAKVRTVRDKEIGNRTGRPPLPAFHKGLKKLLKAVDEAVSEPVDPAVFERYPAEQVEELLASVDERLEKLEQLRAQLRGAVAGAR